MSLERSCTSIDPLSIAVPDAVASSRVPSRLSHLLLHFCYAYGIRGGLADGNRAEERGQATWAGMRLRPSGTPRRKPRTTCLEESIHVSHATPSSSGQD